MEQIKVKLEIKNNDYPYIYEGKASIINNKIAYKYNNELVTFDLLEKVLTKTNNNKKIIIDFKNKFITINTDEGNLKVQIETTEKIVNDNKINIIYNLEGNKIEFILIIERGYYDKD